MTSDTQNRPDHPDSWPPPPPVLVGELNRDGQPITRLVGSMDRLSTLVDLLRSMDRRNHTWVWLGELAAGGRYRRGAWWSWEPDPNGTLNLDEPRSIAERARTPMREEKP